MSFCLFKTIWVGYEGKDRIAKEMTKHILLKDCLGKIQLLKQVARWQRFLYW